MTYPFLFFIKRVTKRGYSSKEASTEMAKLSSQFASISPGMTTDEAQEGLVSIMKAFDVDPENVKSEIMDKVNVLGNKFAENNQDVVEGLKRSSAAMAAMGQTFEDTAALFTGGMEILQDSESMGTALRSVAMRIRGYSEETGELDGELQNVNGDVLSLTKTAKDSQGVSIFTDATQEHYRSMVDYLGEIADRWDDISEQNQTEILNKLFAKTRAQAGAAILKNFSQVRQALVEMENATGSADAEMSTIESSIEYKINNFKQTWVGLTQELIDRGVVGKVVDFFTTISEGIDVVVNKFGLLNTSILAISTLATKNNIGIFTFNSNIDKSFGDISLFGKKLSEIGKSISNFKTKFSELYNSDDNTNLSFFERISNVIESLQNEDSSLLGSLFGQTSRQEYENEFTEFLNNFEGSDSTLQDFMDQTEGMSDRLRLFLETTDEGSLDIENFRQFLDQTSISTKLAKVAFTGLAIAGNALASMLVSQLVSGLVDVIQASNTIASTAKEIGSEFSNTSSNIETYKQKIDELKDTINDSHSSIEEVTNARSELLDVQNEMITKFGSEKTVIDEVTDAINNQTSALDELTKSKWNDTLNNFNQSNGFAEDFSNYIFGYDTNVDRMKSEYGNYANSIDFRNTKIDENLKKELRNLGATINTDEFGKVSFVSLSGNATEVYKNLQQIQDLADQYDIGDKIKANIDKATSSAKSMSDQYKDFWNQYIQYEKIFKNQNYNNSYKNLINDHDDIDDAFTNGDTSGREKAIQDYATELQSAIDLAIANGDTDVVYYLENMYPDIKSEVDQWRFKLNFEANTDGIQDTVINALSLFTNHTATDKDGNIVNDGYTTERLLKFNESTSNDPQLNTAYNTLKSTASTLHIDFNTFIKLLENLGLIVSDAKQQLLDKYIDNVDDINSLSPEDLNLAYKLDDGTIDSWDKLKEKIRLAKEEQDKIQPFSKSDMISEINGLSEGFEELDKIMKSMKSDDAFEYNLLDDKNFKENFSSYSDEYSNFVNTIAEHSKDLGTCQSAFDDLATAYLYNSDVLKGLSDDTANVTTQYLKLMGIQNADEIVTANLATCHAEAAWKAQDLTNATAEEIQQLASESEQTEIGRQAYAAYIAQKLINATINTSGDISALMAEVSQLGVNINAWRQYYAAKKDMAALANSTTYTDASGRKSKQVVVDRATGNALTSKNGKYYNADGTEHTGATYTRVVSDLSEKQIKKTITSFETNLMADIAPVKGYTGPTSTNSSGSGGSGGSDTKENSTIDWISRTSELLKRKSEELETAIQDTWTAYTGLSEKDIKRVQELFSLPFDPNSNEAQELLSYANTLGISLDELKNRSENNGLESRQSLLQQLVDVDQARLDHAIKSLDYYKDSYEDLVSKVPDYRDKIENGGIDIESVSSDQKTNVENAMNAYDSYLDLQKEIQEIQDSIRDNKIKYYDQIIDYETKENERLSSNNDLIEKQIDLLTTRGNIVDASTYESMIDNTKSQIGNTKSIISNRKKKLEAAMDDGLEVGDEEWYELTSAISEAEGNLLDLQKQQEEYNKKLKEMPITNLSTIINMYKDISTAIQNWGAEVEASGMALTADYYQELIKNGSTIISEYKEQASVIQDIMDTYDVGSDNWNDLYSQLQSVNSEMSSMIQNLKKWNEEMLQLPLTKISDYSSNLSTVKDALTSLQDEYTTVISAVTSAIDDETQAIQDQQEAYQKSIEKQTDAIQDKIDLLEKQNTKLQLQQSLEQALYDLQTANTQKTEKVNLLPSSTVM